MAQELKIAGAWRYQRVSCACWPDAHDNATRGRGVVVWWSASGVIRVAGIVAVTRLALDVRQLVAIMAWEPTPGIRPPTRDRSPAT
ncbi:hypothetical protein FHR55_002891 [Xanthomonas arboricola]